jgi:hypothetical protein
VTPFPRLPVRADPFPHAVADDWLEPELYAELSATFPDCPPASGPTGYTSFWGDPDYDRLMAESAAWRTLFERYHSQAFVDYMLGQFGDVFAEQCVHDLSAARYVPYREDRIDKESPQLRAVVHAPDELWVRVDLMQGRIGYDRGVHLDHRRRAATLLIYMSDGDETGMRGGDLILHGRSGKVTVRPTHNRAAMFACSNESWHSVSPIRDQASPRNFVQVTLSSSVDLWAPLPPPSLARRMAARAASLLR